MNSASGYACAVNGSLRVDTVSPSEMAAKVNGLTTLFGVLVTRHHSTQWIADCWEKLTRESENRLEIVRVVVSPKQD